MSKDRRTKAQLILEANKTITMFIDKYVGQFRCNGPDCLRATYGNSTDACPNSEISCGKCKQEWVENKRKELLDKYLLK